MIFYINKLSYILMFFIVSISYADENKNPQIANDVSIKTNQKYILCKSGKAVRTLRMDKIKGLYVSTYTKEGLEQIVSTNSNFQACENVINNIQKKLESGNWSCRDISQSKISTPTKEQ